MLARLPRHAWPRYCTASESRAPPSSTNQLSPPTHPPLHLTKRPLGAARVLYACVLTSCRRQPRGEGLLGTVRSMPKHVRVLVLRVNFQYPQQCLQFVKSNTFPLLRKAKSVYPTQDVDNIYCITKEKLKVLISGSNV